MKKTLVLKSGQVFFVISSILPHPSCSMMYQTKAVEFGSSSSFTAEKLWTVHTAFFSTKTARQCGGVFVLYALDEQILISQSHLLLILVLLLSFTKT